jgi:hypothetical protein
MLCRDVNPNLEASIEEAKNGSQLGGLDAADRTAMWKFKAPIPESNRRSRIRCFDPKIEGSIHISRLQSKFPNLDPIVEPLNPHFIVSYGDSRPRLGLCCLHTLGRGLKLEFVA